VNLYRVDPLSDSRWDDLVAHHPRATVFHQRGWLQALARTYGYVPFVLTSTAPGRPLKDGIVLCRVSSWITGTRLVSLPFSDHCDPLLNDSTVILDFIEYLRAESTRQHCRYIEIRPLSPIQGQGSDLQESGSYCFHVLDLRPGLAEIFQGFHKDSIQRKIRRAEREGLSYEVGRSRQLIEEFYRLLLMTRRRHRLLPQPKAWFKNLVECLGDKAQIRVARNHGAAIAAMLTLQSRSTIVYKYGCSDEKFHPLGSMPFLFWKLVEDAKQSGAELIDFGRSDLDQEGLIVFKDRLGAQQKPLKYYRYPPARKLSNTSAWGSRAIRRFFSMLPDPVLSAAGGLYRHLG
jgi:CelD/BcsL family acetyltransferase involved in cellulose biosynthesis